MSQSNRGDCCHSWVDVSVNSEAMQFVRWRRRGSIINGDSKNAWQHKRQLAVHVNPSCARGAQNIYNSADQLCGWRSMFFMFIACYQSITFAHKLTTTVACIAPRPVHRHMFGDSHDLHVKTNTSWTRIVFARPPAIAQQESFHAPVHRQSNCRIY